MKRKSGNAIMKIIDLAATVISIAAAVALIASYLAPHIDPNTVWYFAFFGLFAPIIFVVNVVLALYWACRWSPMFFVCAVALLAGIGNISKFYRPPLSRTYNTTAEENGTIKIFSFNVEGFIAMGPDQKSRSTAKEILDFVKELDPDIICFQEYQSTPLFSQEKIDIELSAWENRAFNYSKGEILGIAMYSKFPIISNGNIEFKDSNNGVIYANVLVGKNDTLRIINNHLETTYVDRGNLAFLDYHNFPEADDKKRRIAQIGRRLKKGFTIRALQADTITRFIASSPLPTIVCGDFNDTPLSYVYREIRGTFRDSFEDKGSGLGYTFKPLYRILRIDYILHSRDMETITYDSPDVKWSDHNPVMARMKLVR